MTPQPVAAATMYKTKISGQPFYYGNQAHCSVFGMATQAQAEEVILRTSADYRPTMEIWALRFTSLLPTADETVLEGRGSDVQGMELVKTIRGAA